MRKYLVILALFSFGFVVYDVSLKRIKPEKVGISSEHMKYADEAIERAIAENQIPGAVLAVVKNGRLPYIKAYGSKCLYPEKEKMKENTVFDMASCTKSIVTSVCAMILIERGQLAMNDNLDIFYTDFNKNKLCHEKRTTIRIRHLLTHSSGLPSYVKPEKLSEHYDTLNRANLIEYIANSERRFMPDSSVYYSCLNYILMQDIIEKVTGQSLRDFAKENIFDVLGMKNTDFIPLDPETGEPIKPMVGKSYLSAIAPTELITKDSAYVGIVHDPLARVINHGVSGNAGLFSTAEDLAVFTAALINDGVYDGKRILSPLGVKTLTTVSREMEKFGRTPGWDIYSAYATNKGDLLSPNTYGHTGYTGTSLVIDKENNLAIILLTNYVHQKGHNLRDILHLRGCVANSVAASLNREN